MESVFAAARGQGADAQGHALGAAASAGAGAGGGGAGSVAGGGVAAAGGGGTAAGPDPFGRISVEGICAMLRLPSGSVTRIMTFPLPFGLPMTVTSCPAGSCTACPATVTETGWESSYWGSAAKTRTANMETATALASVAVSRIRGVIFMVLWWLERFISEPSPYETDIRLERMG